MAVKHLFTIVLFIYSFGVYSVELNSEEDIKTSFNDAEWYFMIGDYSNARLLYSELVKSDKNNSNYNYKLGVTILFDIKETNEKEAEKYLAVAIQNTTINYKNNYKEKAAPIDAFVYYADVLRYQYKFDEAIKYYQKYLELLNGKKSYFTDYINREIKNCKTAKQMVNDGSVVKKIDFGPKIINSKKIRSFALVSDDKTVSVFSYGQNNLPYGNIIYEFNDVDYKTDDIYFSVKENNKWSEPINITQNLGLKHQSFPVSISADGETLFVVQDDNDNGNIYVSHYINNKWTKIKKLNKNINSKRWETHATLSLDGKTLYFASDRKSGYGGFDIYYSKLQDNGEWGQAVNLGETINTKYDEDLPFIAADNTRLYFCSQGHNSIGGYDIFKSEIVNGVFSKPENVGLAINTPKNDLFYVSNEDNKFIFSKLANDESYVIERPKPLLVSIIGTVNNKNNNSKITNIKITGDSASIIDLQTNNNNFTFSAPKQNNTYIIKADGYKDKEINIDLSNFNSQTKKITVNLEPVEQDIIVDNTTNNNKPENNTINDKPSDITENTPTETTFNNCVLFDFNSTQIKDKYKKYLNKIVKQANNKNIEIYAYADIKGSEEYNYNLSKRRAVSVKKYLESQGVASAKIKLIPKGETTKFKTDSLNRRAEIKINSSIGNTENNLSNNSQNLILFDFDKYNLTAKAKTAIDKTVANITKDKKITIHAYTDSKGSNQYNKILSKKRAETVKKYLIQKGYSVNNITAKGKGILQNNSADYLKRKAEIIIE